MVIQSRLYTISEFEAFADTEENGHRLFELIDGEIVEKVPTELHGIIAANFTIEIGIYLKLNKIGRVAIEPRHKAPNDDHNARLPDVAFTSNERALPIVTKGSVPQLPDLAIEIKSPTDTYVKMRNKAAFYIANGCRMVWLVYPEKRMIEVYQPNTDVEILLENERLSGGDVLLGFTITVSDVFPND